MLHNNVPEDVVNDQWISIVNFWRSDEGQERSARSRLSHKKAKTKPIHTSSTKSHARVYEDLKKSLQRSPTRTEVYLECHQHTNEADVTGRIKEIAAQQEHLDGNLDDDPVAQVLGKDKYGRVRGLGLGVKPSDLVEPSPLCCSNGLNMSTTDETTSMYLIRQLKDQIQAMNNRIIRQGNTITKLKRKLRNTDGFTLSDLKSSESSSDDSSSSSEGESDHDN
ncbi:uncharacterized protein LOC141639677 [Silene latifolia]|uniref:uncharacterized protein LOC141639677 n=1 Tax=Silene latifolia TaxID=37657 RepID=UPI003D77BD9C